MKNIYVKMGGRLGNQLFRYAAARYLQVTQGGDLKFNFNSVYDEAKRKPEEGGFEDNLKNFKVADYEITTDSIIKWDVGIPIQKILFCISTIPTLIGKVNSKWFDKLNSINSKFGYYMSTGGPKYCEFKKTNVKSAFLHGRFEDIRYFNDIREILLEELQPKYPIVIENKILYNIIKNCNSVCVSIRRGDYISNISNEKIFNVCTKEYFENAIDYVKCEIENPVFIIFSDDINWCKKNIDFIKDNPCYFETGNDPIWEKLRLMYSCKHFIISNSTFSWWSQYLSRNNEKIVVCPDRWFKHTDQPYPLILDSFIKIGTKIGRI